jgi:hypothetical protein
MTVEPVTPEDAPVLLDLARKNGRAPWQILGGDHGVVARDEQGVAGFAFLREAPFGMVIDELWCYPDNRGREALSALTAWLEATVAGLAHERGMPLSLGGVVRLENEQMDQAMEKRGYEVVGHVRAKVIA